MDHLNHKLSKDPQRVLDKYSSYLIWGRNPITYKDSYKYKMAIKSKHINKIANEVLDFKKMYIFYSGKQNFNKEINNVIKKI